MALLGKIFGSEKALEATIGGITKGLDSLVYTDEEKKQTPLRSADGPIYGHRVDEQYNRAETSQKAYRCIHYVCMATAIRLWLGDGDRCHLGGCRDSGQDAGSCNTDPGLCRRHDRRDHADIELLLAAPHMDKIVGPAMERFAKTNRPEANK